jgi:prophage regulatory protein
MEINVSDKILRINELKEKLGVSSCTIWRWRKLNQFPNHIKLGKRLIGFRESEIDEWLANQKQ